MSEQEKKNTSIGDSMYVESLMAPEEWQRRMIRYPNTSHKYLSRVNKNKTNSFKWRFGMGNTLSSTEIGNINSNLDYLRKKAKV
jgi:hypothetical protein